MVFIAVSSALSFVLFINALVCTYKCDWLWKKCTTPPEQDDQIKPLDPFQKDDEQHGPKTSVAKINLPESLYFVVLFSFNFLFWVACLVMFSVFHFGKPYYTNKDNKNFKSNLPGVEVFGFLIYMYSLLCTIVSCFIFSKIAYSVTHRCLKLYNELNCIITARAGTVHNNMIYSLF